MQNSVTDWIQSLGTIAAVIVAIWAALLSRSAQRETRANTERINSLTMLVTEVIINGGGGGGGGTDGGTGGGGGGGVGAAGGDGGSIYVNPSVPPE